MRDEPALLSTQVTTTPDSEPVCLVSQPENPMTQNMVRNIDEVMSTQQKLGRKPYFPMAVDEEGPDEMDESPTEVRKVGDAIKQVL
jgi:hypothetical protein